MGVLSYIEKPFGLNIFLNNDLLIHPLAARSNSSKLVFFGRKFKASLDSGNDIICLIPQEHKSVSFHKSLIIKNNIKDFGHCF